MDRPVLPDGYYYLTDVLELFQDGDEHGWDQEFAYLATRWDEMEPLIDSIRRDGIRNPIHLGNDGRIWDGHHRIYAAHLLGIEAIPVTY
jgi:hypothetical protein